MSEWISVNDRLPEEGREWVLVFADGAMNCMMFNRSSGSFYDATYAQCHNVCIDDITHWMPLPAAPEVKQ